MTKIKSKLFNTNIDMNEIDNHITILKDCIEAQSQLETTSVSNQYEPDLLKFVKRWRISKYTLELDFWKRLKQQREQ